MLTTNSIADLTATLATPVVVVSATVILIASLVVICGMTNKTNHMVRLYYTTISASAFYELMSIVGQAQPTFGEALLCSGVALLMVFDRRSGVLCRRGESHRIRGHHVSK